jgi:hypothetical protein
MRAVSCEYFAGLAVARGKVIHPVIDLLAGSGCLEIADWMVQSLHLHRPIACSCCIHFCLYCGLYHC